MKKMDFKHARDWLAYCSSQPEWQQGDQPSLMISYAGEDHDYVKLVRKHLDRPLSQVLSEGTPFKTWDYARFGSGTTLGSHFPTEVAIEMWRCRAAMVFISPDYVKSDFCFEIELPFLLWRMQHHGMRLFLLRLNETSLDNKPVLIPDFNFPVEHIDLKQFVDDRNPALMERFDEHSEKLLKELVRERPEKAEARLANYARRVCELLTLDEAKRISGHSNKEPVAEADHRLPNPDYQPENPKHRTVDRSSGPLLITTAATVTIAAAAMLAYLLLNPAGDASQSLRPAQRADAIQACEAVAGSPFSPKHQTDRGGIAFDSLDPTKLDICLSASNQNPTLPDIAFATGRLLEKAGRVKEAYDRYKVAFQAGNALAANNIGVLYRDTQELFKSFTGPDGCRSSEVCDLRAVDWFVTARNAGLDAVRFNLGLMYEDRRGVIGRAQDGCRSEQDCDTNAINHFGPAALGGDSDAQLHLSWLMIQQRGTNDRQDSFACNSKAACENLGLAWLDKAIANGNPDARKFQEQLLKTRPDLKRS